MDDHDFHDFHDLFDFFRLSRLVRLFCGASSRQVFESRAYVFSHYLTVHARQKKNMPVSISHKLNTGIYKPFCVHGAPNQRPSSQKLNLTMSKRGHILMLIPVIVRALLP